MEFNHIILTRFNVKINWAGKIKPDSDWLRHRFVLFDKFNFPSMYTQSNQNFKWLVLFDINTPDYLKDRIKAYSKWKCFIPIYIQKFSFSTYCECVKSLLDEGTKGLITTRLDNDDAVSMQFVDSIQENFHSQPFLYLNFPNGYLLSQNTLYRVIKHANAFISLFEKSENYITAWYGNHRSANIRGPIQDIYTDPVWMQVIHEYNIKNSIGRAHMIVPITELKRSFSISL